MQIKAKVFLFSLGFIVEKEILDWLEKENVIVVTANTVATKDYISHIVYYMKPLSISDSQILTD